MKLKNLKKSVSLQLNTRLTPSITFITESQKANRMISNHVLHYAKLFRRYLMASNSPYKGQAVYITYSALGYLRIVASYNYPDMQGMLPVLPATQDYIAKGGW